MYYFDEHTIIFLDGNWVKAPDLKINVYNQTLHYGYGVFEGLRSYETLKGIRIFKALEHFERLIRSANKMHINFDYNAKDLVDIAYKLLAKNKLKNTYIRPLVYLDNNMSVYPSKEVHLMMMVWDWSYYQKVNQIDVTISSYERINPKSGPINAKVVGHLTNTMLATAEAKKNGFDDAILIDNNGYIAQGSGSNFFIEIDEELFTPPLGNIFPGVTRSTVIDLAKRLGYPIQEAPLKIEDIKKTSSAFMTGTAIEITSIKSIENRKFPLKWEDSLGYNLFLAYRQLVKDNEVFDFEII